CLLAVTEKSSVRADIVRFAPGSGPPIDPARPRWLMRATNEEGRPMRPASNRDDCRVSLPAAARDVAAATAVEPVEAPPPYAAECFMHRRLGLGRLAHGGLVGRGGRERCGARKTKSRGHHCGDHDASH